MSPLKLGKGEGGALTVGMRVLFISPAISCPIVSRKRSLEWTAVTTMLGDLGERPAAEVTRAEALSPIESYAHIPVQAQILRRELGAAWEYCHDAGKLPEAVPNWWRAILCGKLKSKGKAINGKKKGVKSGFAQRKSQVD